MDSELRNKIYHDTTRITNELNPLRRGDYHTVEQVLEHLDKAYKILHQLQITLAFPQLKLWEK